ncbi:MAG: hypothetical protein IPF93_08365 [Saprospiraceae bacterium]|nr:hypothetical protein [Saprospiraceae bacterium]
MLSGYSEFRLIKVFDTHKCMVLYDHRHPGTGSEVNITVGGAVAKSMMALGGS